MKKRYLFFALIICLFAISAVSAEEIANDNDSGLIAESANEEYIGIADNGTFTDLQKKIDDANESSTIILENDYAYDEGFSTEGIYINKALTINGNGHTIDALDESRIFYIDSNDVALINITFKNGNSLYGGANFFEGTLNNITIIGDFIDNYAEDGGANYFEDTLSNATIIGDYTNNIASKSGGANYFFGALSNVLILANFTDNVAESGSGGANFFMNKIANVTLTGNYTRNIAKSDGNGSDKTGSGGANCFNQTVNDILLLGNYTDNIGYRGTNYFYKDANNVYIFGNYKNNTGILFGGAIYFMNPINSTIIIGDYTNNKATNNGGALFINKLATNVAIYGNYINNTGVEGSAIYINRPAENVSISGNFIDNQGNNTIHMNDSISNNAIYDSIFINDAGNEIFVFTGETQVIDTWFGNNATNYNEKPAVVNVNMTNWLFLNATAEPDKVTLNKNSTVTFKLYSYNETSKEISEYDSSMMEAVLKLSQTLGELNQTTSLIAEKIAYTAKESGNASVTGRFESTYYTISIISLQTVNGTDIVKMYKNATQYYATFLDAEGNFLADGTAVKFTVNGVTYERQVSGDKGLAKLNINLNPGEYEITATNPVTGETANNTITVLSNIIENKDIIKYYKNATQYTVKIIGADGKAVGAGETVTFNINGVFYNRTTDESGIAKLNINLHPGNYTITAEYNGCRVSNNITVLPVLTAEDLTKKYGTPDQFVATLVDGQGKAFAGESIAFNVNGVLYSKVTDGNGQAKLNIILMPGEYIITSSYNGTNIANKITVQS